MVGKKRRFHFLFEFPVVLLRVQAVSILGLICLSLFLSFQTSDPVSSWGSNVLSPPAILNFHNSCNLIVEQLGLVSFLS